MKNLSATSVVSYRQQEQRLSSWIQFQDGEAEYEFFSQRKKRARVRNRATKVWKTQRGKGYLRFANELKRRVRTSRTPWIYFKTEQWAKWLGRSRQTLETYLERFIRENSGYYCERTQVEGRKNAYFRRMIGHESKMKHDWYPLFISKKGKNRHLRPHLRRFDYVQKDGRGEWILPGSRNPFKQTKQCQIQSPSYSLSMSFRHQQKNLNSFAQNKSSDCAFQDAFTPKKSREGLCPPLPHPEFTTLQQKPARKDRIPKKILRLAGFLKPEIQALHWENCNIESNPNSQFFYLAESLMDGHSKKKIIFAYEKALHQCHAHALDSTSSNEVAIALHQCHTNALASTSSDEALIIKSNGFPRWKCTSTIFRAKQILNKDGLDRQKRIKQLKQQLHLSNVTPGQN